MTIYAVDVCDLVHTCPADPQPHVWMSVRRVIHTTPGGPCQQPVTIRCGIRQVVIPCGRHVPAAQQCGPCRTITVTHHHRTITTPPAGRAT